MSAHDEAIRRMAITIAHAILIGQSRNTDGGFDKTLPDGRVVHMTSQQTADELWRLSQ